MTTQASIGHNTLFKRDDGAGNYVTLAEVTNVTPPSLARDTVDATHMASPERYREFISGLRDGGEVSLEMNFIPGGSGMTALLADFNNDAAVSYRITFPNAVDWTFSGFLTGIDPQAPVDDKMTISVTFKITGKPTLT